MLSEVNISKKIDKDEYKTKIKPLKTELEIFQRTIQKHKISVIILIEGWEAAGKGTAIKKIIEPLDPRNFNVFSGTIPTEVDKRYPFLKRYWDNIPKDGEILILNKSWYSDIYSDAYNGGLSDEEIEKRIESVNTFERQLADNRTLILKFFLHISKKKQSERFEELRSDENTLWKVSKKDLKQNEKYQKYFKRIDELLLKTNTPYARWNVIPSEQSEYAVLEMYKVITTQLRRAVECVESGEALYDSHEVENERGLHPSIVVKPILKNYPVLNDIDLTLSMDKEEYNKKLDKLQKRLGYLHSVIYNRKIPVIVLYEGWDAAGKGGNIKRVSEALDPRGYVVNPVAAPDRNELAHHYLWRFWKRLPKDGHIAIFDRSWYGRVMVERIEGFCTENEWKRAYREMNEFEAELRRWGAVIVKFWVDIDKDEQLKRFKEREKNPQKRWKITDEDWRNREKWELYEAAVDEMFRRTTTEAAEWTVLESNDKLYARIKALEVIISAIEKNLSE
ncbi:MAG: polyphosphate:AMP phosphotransferase [Candidatus Pseudoruminococcus sp.]|nr:polyphosphate:AMP phosphotransferase [Ruminococcus sp.]MDY2782449.1 polyphosphate:AMP phosphotransferase [Candidatus Pseudoruminococcus sp.]